MFGLSGTSPLSLLLILVIVVVLFGTKRLKNMGQDLGEAVRSFREGVDEKNKTASQDSDNQSTS